MSSDTDITAEEFKVFLEETDEQIELLDEDIVRLEKEGDNPDLLQEIFRAAHTIKGSSAMLGYQQMAELTHAMESLLDKLRNGELSVSTEIIDILLYSLDALKVLKKDIASSKDSNLDVTPIVTGLKETAGESIGPAVIKEPKLILNQDIKESLEEAIAKGQNIYKIKVSIADGSAWAAVRCLQILNELAQIGEVTGSAPSTKEIEEEKVGSCLKLIFSSSEDGDTIQGVISSVADVDNVEITSYDLEEEIALSKSPAPTHQRTTDHDPKTMDKKPKGIKEAAYQEKQQTFQSIRVDVKILDNLMNMVGELVIDRSRISQVSKMLESRYAGDELIHDLKRTSSHIIKVINELRESIMGVRMVPIGTIFSRFPRLVRDLAQKENKKLDFTMEGEETELDRSIIEQVRDPLIHLLRNAVDHGIETPEKRRAAHKPEMGTVRLAAFREQSHIVITVEDNGNGIDVSRVKNSSVKKGIISTEVMEKLTETEAIDLIFMPGMSTAEKTTEISGRGVGLDIVKTNVESLGGSLNLDTKVGQGSKFTIRLPLTIAIIQGLLVSSDGIIFIAPIASMVETLRIEPSEIETIRGKELIRLRDSIIPLLRLNKVLGNGTTEIESNDKIFIVVVNTGGGLVGIMVDALMEQQEIVVKSLGKYLGDIEGIAGATILGDGQVALILDIGSLVKMATQSNIDNIRQQTEVVSTLNPTPVR